jgi:hypothetical protein
MSFSLKITFLSDYFLWFIFENRSSKVLFSPRLTSNWMSKSNWEFLTRTGSKAGVSNSNSISARIIKKERLGEPDKLKKLNHRVRHNNGDILTINGIKV